MRVFKFHSCFSCADFHLRPCTEPASLDPMLCVQRAQQFALGNGDFMGFEFPQSVSSECTTATTPVNPILQTNVHEIADLFTNLHVVS